MGEMHHTLKKGVSMQVILTISQIMWCRDLTECLEREDGNHLEALEAFEKVNFEVRLRQGDIEHSTVPDGPSGFYWSG